MFAAIERIDCWFEKERIKKEATLKNVLLEYPNPEDINNHPDTAPSVRLKKHIPGYRKVDDGIGIIQAVGIDCILKRCPHFKAWIFWLEQTLMETD